MDEGIDAPAIYISILPVLDRQFSTNADTLAYEKATPDECINSLMSQEKQFMPRLAQENIRIQHSTQFHASSRPSPIFSQSTGRRPSRTASIISSSEGMGSSALEASASGR